MSEKQDSNKVFKTEITFTRTNDKQKAYITDYSIVETVKAFEDLKAVARFDHAPCIFKDNYRNNANFQSANVVEMDCDNEQSENPEEWISPEKLHEKLSDVEFAVIYSRNHMKLKKKNEKDTGKSARPRYHVYFSLGETITDGEKFEKIKKTLQHFLPFFDDGNNKISQCIYGVDTPDGVFYHGSKNILDWIKEQAKQVEPKEKKSEALDLTKKSYEKDFTLVFDLPVNEKLQRPKRPYRTGEGRHPYLFRFALNKLLSNQDEEKALELLQEEHVIVCEDLLTDDEILKIFSCARKSDVYQCRLLATECIATNDGDLIDAKNVFTERAQEFKPEHKKVAWQIALSLAKRGKKKNKKEQKTNEDFANAEADFLEGKLFFSRGTPKHEEIYEYNHELGYWIEKNFGDLRHDIRKHFNKQIDDLTKNKIATHIYEDNKFLDDVVMKWNKFEKWNFKNGTLNLETGEFEKHAPKNAFNYVMPYEYNAQSECPKFRKFIKDFVNAEPTRLKTVEDMLGYILCSDTREQKLFFLYGHGGNGKTTLSNVLKYVLGGQNEKLVASVPITDLDKQTERSDFEQARLNFCPDNEYFITAEQCASLKRLTGSDIIRSNKKFKDTKEIKPTTKYIFGFNDTPILSDMQEGMVDRLVFVKLEKNFRRSAELNKNLEKELKAERVGIFNYIFECYKALKANGGIRTCCDQLDLLQKTKIKNNLVAMWYDEEHEDLCGKQYARTVLYENFLEWCKSMNFRKIYGRNTFYEKMRDFLTASIGHEEHKDFGDFFVFEPMKEPEKKELPKQVEQVQDQEPQKAEAEEINLLADERTKVLIEKVNYRLSFDKQDFYRELRRVKGDFNRMFEFLTQMQAKQGDKWKYGEYQIVIDETSDLYFPKITSA